MEKEDIEIVESDNESEVESTISDDMEIEDLGNDKEIEDDLDEDISENGDDDEIDGEGEDSDEDENIAIDDNDAQYEPFNINDDLDDDDDESYLQKFDDDVKEKVIETHHPETIVHNNEEVQAACIIVRDEYGNIIDPLHTTIPLLTCYEKARILGERATQLNNGANPLVEIDENMIDGYIIALKELDEKRIPFVIQRPLPNGTSEYWRVKDLDVY